jgi:EpsI family protein
MTPTRLGVLSVILLGAGMLLAFGGPLLAMVEQWNVSPMYSYGYSVPIISAFLLWTRRDALVRERVEPARLMALPVLGLALGLLLVGRVGAVQVIQQLGFLIAIAGVVLFLLGRRHLALSAPALGYLVFMVPLWDAFTEPLHWPFQHNSAQLGVVLMQSAGIPVHRDGVFVALPNLLIEVARECSGVNYLVAVIALAVPLSFIRLRSPWRRAVLVGSALIIAALANGVRVALIGSLAYYEVGAPLHGPFHVLHGLFVAGVGYLALFVGLRLLQDPGPGAPPLLVEHRRPAGPLRWSTRDAAGLALVFWLLVLPGAAPRAAPVTAAHPLEALPYRLGGWVSLPLDHPQDGGAGPSPWQTADHQMRRQYRDADGRTVAVDIHYFEAQTQARKLANYLVVDLHREAETRDIALPTGSTLRVNALRWPGRDEAALFWYDFGGAQESGYHAARLRTAWHALKAGRTHGAVVVVRSDGSFDRAAAALRSVAAEVHLALQPLWTARTRADSSRHVTGHHRREGSTGRTPAPELRSSQELERASTAAPAR